MDIAAHGPHVRITEPLHEVVLRRPHGPGRDERAAPPRVHKPTTAGRVSRFGGGQAANQTDGTT